MSLTPPNRRVITFYSFKGGVGRTMTLANVAYRLANKHGLRVIAVDWDLEAPGLHRFFGVSPRKAAKARGVLDYFGEWREAVKRRDPAPPSVRDWIIPITDKKHKPNFGSLSLLLAGKIDEGYDERLAALNWQEFYEMGAGASAVETLREQLVGIADVVLIDSRTGFTDSGGICTIQVPDGVVLMTAPNQQSLEGIDRVARGIAKAPKEARAGRDKPGMWLVTSRVPMVEETYLAERWFKDNNPWFAAGSQEGLWLKEDHPEGIKSHKIPHRSRWGFDEAVLNEMTEVDPSDVLSHSYKQLTETVARWLRGEPPIGMGHHGVAATKHATSDDIQALEAEIAEAERRGDVLGMAFSLLQITRKLASAGKKDEAVRKADQASGIILSRGSRVQYAVSLYLLGHTLNQAHRHKEALESLAKALDIARESGSNFLEANILLQLAEAHFETGSHEQAQELVTAGYGVLRTIDEPDQIAPGLILYAAALEKFDLRQMAIEAMRHGAQRSRSRGESDDEETALGFLLLISDAGENLPDADALRARLAELKGASPAST